MDKYLHTFENDTARTEYENGSEYIEPYVSLVESDNSVHYNKPPFFCKLTLNNGVIENIESEGILRPNMISYASQTCVSAEIGTLCTTIGSGAFTNFVNLTSVTISDKVTRIEENAFVACTSLINVIIPDSVTYLGFASFAGCSSLESAVISSGLTFLGDSSFQSCTSLISVISKATTPPQIQYNPSRCWVFDGNAQGRKIYVPSDSVNMYKQASMWVYYASDIEPIS